MKYNHAQAEKRFREEWRRRFRFYRENGMTIEQILPLYKMDREELRSDRRYYEHTVPLEDAEPYLSHCPVETLIDETNWTTVLPPELRQQLALLPPERLQAYYFNKICGFTQAEVADWMHKSQASVHYWIVQIGEILKNYADYL